MIRQSVDLAAICGRTIHLEIPSAQGVRAILNMKAVSWFSSAQEAEAMLSLNAHGPRSQDLDSDL